MRGLAFVLAPALAFLAAVPSRAQILEPPSASAKVDRNEAAVGDRIRLEITVRAPAGADLRLAEPPALGPFEAKDVAAGEPDTAGGMETRAWILTLAAYRTGTLVIPPQRVEARLPGDTAVRTAATAPLAVEVRRVSPDTARDIADIAAPRPAHGLFPWGWAPLALAALGLALWLRKRPGRPAPKRAEPPLAPHEEARRALRELRAQGLPGPERARDFAFKLSEILRRYLERAYGVDALESTTDEFLAKVGNLPITPAKRRWLGDFCAGSDLVKYAAAPLAAGAAEAWLKEAWEFVWESRPQAAEAGRPAGSPAAARQPGDVP